MPPYICVIPGDGCGKEVTTESLKILDILKGRGSLEYSIFGAGAEHYERTGESWEEGTMDRARESDAILFGAVGKDGVVKPDGTRPSGEVVFGLRNGLDLYANVRPVDLFPGIAHSISGKRKLVWQPKDVDLVIVRELTEGLYVRTCREIEAGGNGDGKHGGVGGGVVPLGAGGDCVVDDRVTSEQGSRRVIEFACDLALSRRGWITCVDKSNVLVGDRLFRRVFDETTSLPPYSGLTTARVYVDAMAMYLMSNPERYDLLVAPNLYGDILSDLASVLVGGIGMAPSGSYGESNAMFEPIHGSAPDIAGKGVVNPSASLLSTSMMLEYLAQGVGGPGGRGKADRTELRLFSEALHDAVRRTIGSGVRTPDLGGTSTTGEFGDAVVREFLRLAQIRC